MSAQPWSLSDRFDPKAALVADRHYNRQTPGSPQFAPPGRLLVLRCEGPAVWTTSWPYAEFTRHAWAGAWVNSLFRREGGPLASDLIRAAIAATKWKWADVPPLGIVTFVDATQVRSKRDPGYCYLAAGFKVAGTTKGGLRALQMLPDAMPAAQAPIGSQIEIEVTA